MRFISSGKGFMRRKGMSFIEIISSLVIIAMISGAVISSGSLVVQSSKEIAQYSRLRVYATNKIEQIENDLESGEDITSIDYNESGITNGIYADVDIDDIGDAFGDNIYMVSMRLAIRGTNITTRPKAILRAGCSIYDTP